LKWIFALIVGLGYTYSQETSVPTFLTAAVERGSISTLVKASGTVEAVVSVDVSSQLSGRIAPQSVLTNSSISFSKQDGLGPTATGGERGPVA